MTVLILTSEQDVTADLVVARLNGTGVPVVRLDPADLPGTVALSGEYVHGSFRGHLSAGGRQVSMDGLRSIWLRRPGVPASGVADPSRWLTEESSQALYGMLRGTGARWMNDPDAARRARHKPWQLRHAQHCGLPVPATLITTFPQAARDFAERFPDLVVKPVSGTHPREPVGTVPTSRVAPGTDFTAVAFGPTLLQRRIAKTADIRLTVVGDRMLAARKVVAPDAHPDEVDVRFAPSTSPWQPAEVPERTATAVRAYLRSAELSYGAFDFAEDTDGIWWFLECNQSGQFGFVEMDTGQPIAHSVAEWLAHEEPGAGAHGNDRIRTTS
ncbi:ATP-grasp ribosomal peptide maturase [Streptomyces scabiei]|uniref:ATP-grasp ribosomal peptide maturase n=1 Tax=Streptomyces scabiei TaxID=1930 RepID=UPI0007660037|nr:MULTISPECIES: ATP-grasp ribosomal peptide maturase [Streptomyces]MBP5865513.1 ATP-grasp ribosomal peptide maturase [Streptomyces sp. LBUM 1484]MBP5873781.1 ATP-grasp ribosomal peptide maturase [Streptomyces sp. LBUM 1477]MBP5881493.1 ATP-grasp ribosomal peptide maturase [Streptomyces sp. LBUM 1487]MBP5897263.1 ATP-grasp ribosomal peptide maturase [Streptomyces sp. LBUM 1488]MDW8470907.1 ATP-grasp ribosomal peptide maturase [Streptomyces scabiei]